MELNSEGLTDADRSLLEFERGWWTEPGLKTTRMRTELGMSSGKYYRRLADLIDSQAALEFDPLLIRRLRRRRSLDEQVSQASERPQR